MESYRGDPFAGRIENQLVYQNTPNAQRQIQNNPRLLDILMMLEGSDATDESGAPLSESDKHYIFKFNQTPTVGRMYKKINPAGPNTMDNVVRNPMPDMQSPERPELNTAPGPGVFPDYTAEDVLKYLLDNGGPIQEPLPESDAPSRYGRNKRIG